MRRFGKTLLSALAPVAKKGLGLGAKYLLEGVLSKDKDNATRIGGFNVNKIGRSMVKAGENFGKKLLEDNIPSISKSSELHEGMKQLMVYDPFRAIKVPVESLKSIIDNPENSEAERAWAARKKKSIKRKYTVQI